MDEQQLMALLQEIGPERLLMIIQIIEQLTPEELAQFKQALAQEIQGGQQQAQPQAPQGQNNLYG